MFMTQKLGPIPQQTSEQTTALVEIERTRSVENDRTVKLISQKFLGHIYNKETHRIEEMAVVDDFQDKDIVLDDTKSLYVATLDVATETALDRLNNSLGFKISAAVGQSPFKIQASFDYGHTKLESSQSSTVFCAVACVRMDHCGVQKKLSRRKDVVSDSSLLGIIKSISVYAGYRIILEIISSSDKSAKNTTIGVKAEGTTIGKVLGGSIDFTHENSSLAERNIEQINIKEIATLGGYRVPPMEILSNNFLEIQRMFESIREHFEINYYSIVDRPILVHPKEDLDYFRETPSLSSSPILPARSEMEFLEAPIAQRDAAYYRGLATEIMNLISPLEQAYLDYGEHKDPALQLERMLYAIETSFLNLLKLPKISKQTVLLMGTDPFIIRRQGVRLMGGKTQQRKELYPNGYSKIVTRYEIPGQVLPVKFFPDVFNSKFNSSFSGICAYGHILETPLLTNAMFHDEISAENDICAGVATSFMISCFAPTKIIICLPRNFFQLTDLSVLIEKVLDLYESLYRISNPSTLEEGILFVLEDEQDDQIVAGLKKEIVAAFDALKAERRRRSGIMAMITYRFKLTELQEEIEKALDACAFIIKRLAMFSKVRDILIPKTEALSFQPELQVVEDTDERYVLRDGKPSEKVSFVDLSLEAFDRENITLNNSSSFERVLTSALRYMRSIESDVANLERQLQTSFELLKSYDRILTLLRDKEIGKIDKVTAEESLGKAVAEEIARYADKKQKLEKIIGDNAQNIGAKKAELNALENDTTPTPLKLEPDRPMTLRSFWRFFGKKYTFETKREFSKCKFSITSGSFECTEAEFENTKKAVFIPKHWGNEDDLKANIQIWIKNNEQPDTLKAITNLRTDIQRIEKTNSSLEEELKEIETVIYELTVREVKRLEESLAEKIKAFKLRDLKLNQLRAEFMKHHEYFGILKQIHTIYFNPPKHLSEEKPKSDTNYYGLTPNLKVFFRGARYLQEEHWQMKELSEQQKRPVYLITPGNKDDRSFGINYHGDPLFFEYDGHDYHGLVVDFSQKPQEVAKEIERKISEKALKK
jgi:hypothetical protein